MAKAKQPAAAPPDGRLAPPPLIGPNEHPRARGMIARAKAWGGLGGFGVAFLAGLAAGTPLFTTLLRGLLGGIVCYLVAWRSAVAISRSLMQAEAQVAVGQLLDARRRAQEELQAAIAARKAG